MGSHIPIASVGIPDRRTAREARYVACSLPGIRWQRLGRGGRHRHRAQSLPGPARAGWTPAVKNAG